MPHVVRPTPASTSILAPGIVLEPLIFSPQLIQAFFSHLNQQNPNEIPFNQIAPLATRPLRSIHPSTESTNVYQEKDLDLELRPQILINTFTGCLDLLSFFSVLCLLQYNFLLSLCFCNAPSMYPSAAQFLQSLRTIS